MSNLKNLFIFIGTASFILAFVSLGSSCGTATYNIAALSCDKKETTKARSECKGLKMMTNKQRANFHIKKSRNYLSDNQIQNAVNSSREAVKAAPEYARAYYNRGVAQMNNGDNNEAILSFDKAIKNNPRLSQAYYFKGLMQEGLHNYGAALKSYKKATEVFPDYAIAHYHLGFLQKHRQQHKQATKTLLRAYEIWKQKVKYNPQYFHNQPDVKTAFYKTQEYLRGAGAIQNKSYFSYAN